MPILVTGCMRFCGTAAALVLTALFTVPVYARMTADGFVGRFDANGDGQVSAEGQWMDPNALYRNRPPFDSHSTKALPDSEKRMTIPVMLENGTTVPAATRLIWPYRCTRD